MSLIENINITPAKLDALMKATAGFKETGLLFIGRSSDSSEKTFAIIDHLNFGFSGIFPYFSNLFDIDARYLVSFFFLLLFLGSFLITLLSSILICKNKNKIIPLFLIIGFFYILIYKYVLISNAEYFIYFFWGLMPLPYFYFLKKSFNIQLLFIFIVSFLLIILGSLLYYSYISFLIFYLIATFLNEKLNYKKFILLIPLISFLFLTQIESYSNNLAVKNLIKIKNINLSTDDSYRAIGNSSIVAFYAGLGYLRSDYFTEYFHDSEVFKLVGKLDENGSIIKKTDWNSFTKLNKQDIEIIKNKIIEFIFKSPLFIFKTIFAKLGILLGFFLIICNFSLLFFFSKKLKFQYSIPLLANLLVAMIFPIISIPSKLYSLTFLGASLAIFIVSYCKNRKII